MIKIIRTINFNFKIYNKIPLSKLGTFVPSTKDIELFKKEIRNKPELIIWGLDMDFIINGINNI